jgi:hypothetical protein
MKMMIMMMMMTMILKRWTDEKMKISKN